MYSPYWASNAALIIAAVVAHSPEGSWNAGRKPRSIHLQQRTGLMPSRFAMLRVLMISSSEVSNGSGGGAGLWRLMLRS